MGGKHQLTPWHRRKNVRRAFRALTVFACLGLAFFVSEWIVSGAALLSLAKWVGLASDEVEF